MPLNFAQDMAISTARFREELGYSDPVPDHEGVRRTVAWERKTPGEFIVPAMFDYPAEDAVLD